jgi:hypothetical protein
MMAHIHCPMCGKLNPPELDECQFCGARIKPILASTPLESKPIQAGEKLIKSGTSEFEKVRSLKDGSIHPGEVPTKKNTAELEKALPSWLRSLRDGKNSAENASPAGTASGEKPPATPDANPGSDSPGALPDWLTGLEKSASEDEEVPDWLVGLRSDKTAESAIVPDEEGQSTPELGNPDWMARLGGESQAAAFESPLSEKPVLGGSSEPPSADLSPDWLQSLQSTGSSSQEPPVSSQGEEKNLPDWFSSLPGIPADSEPALGGTQESAPAEGLPDWLNQFQEKTAGPEPDQPAAGAESTPDWLSGFGTEAGAPISAPTENVPEWLSNLEEKSSTEFKTPAAFIGSDSQVAGSSAGETPDWLSQLQADVNTAEEVEKHKDDFEIVSELPAQTKGTEPLPEWLAGIERTAPPSSGTPALIVENKGNPPGDAGETAFSMEAPDWLSKLKPEQGAEKGTESEEEQPSAGNIEAAALPSWVQAMRPVESVVAEAKTTPLNEDQVTEQSGPLAGLVGVLPSGPGLGLLRKPPAYSAKLQVSEGQQRYVTYFDQLVAGETHPHTAGAARLTSNRLWRWLITLLLVMAVGLPLITGSQVTPALSPSLLSSDKGAAATVIEGLQANAPVLVAFDYEPALSGELEAVAAPLFDQLLSKGVRLTLVSTSPTGPALAERFLQTTPLVNAHQYRSGEQYVNLGYLVEGPASISYFAGAPAEAMPVTVNGDPAWATPPLQGILHLSDFAAVVILTDNADTGRNWIEQSSQYLGKTPMVMVISAQAEPMIRPYFDSGQLKGLVSGLVDAKIYEQSYNRPGLAYHYWDSFSFGVFVVELLIVIGATWSALAAWRTRSSDTGGKA